MMVKDEIGTIIGHIEKFELSDNYEMKFVTFSELVKKRNIKDNIVINLDLRFLSFDISEV